MNFNASLRCVANVLGLIQSRVVAPDSSSYIIIATDADLISTRSLKDLFVDDGSWGDLRYDTSCVMVINNGRDILPFAWIPENEHEFIRKDGAVVRVKAIVKDIGIDFRRDGFIVVLSSASIERH